MIEIFNKRTFEQKTAWPLPNGKKFQWTRIKPTTSQWVYEWDIPIKNEDAPLITIRIYSSIDCITNRTREKAGDDSIRVVAMYNGDEPWKWPGQFWITRQPGWEDRLFACIQRYYQKIAPEGRLRRCPRCGGIALVKPKRKSISRGRDWFVLCYNENGPCYERYRDKSGRIRDNRWIGWES